MLYYLFTCWVLCGSDVHLPLFQTPQLKVALLAQWVSLLPVLERRDSSCQVCQTSKTASSKECTVQIYYSIKIMVLLEYLLSLDMGGDRSFPYTVWWYLLTYLTKPMHLSLCHKYILLLLGADIVVYFSLFPWGVNTQYWRVAFRLSPSLTNENFGSAMWKLILWFISGREDWQCWVSCAALMAFSCTLTLTPTYTPTRRSFSSLCST